MDIIMTIIWTILLCIIVGGGIYIWFLSKWNKTVLIHKRVNNVTFAFFDKARSFIDTDSQERWRLQLEKVTIDVPPNNAIRVLPNGKIFAECEKVSDMEYVWWQVDNQHIDGKLKAAKFVPIPHGVKTGFFNQYKKVIDRLQNNFWAKVAQYAPMLLLVIVCVIGLLMFNNIKEHNTAIAASNANIAESINQVTANLNDLTTRYADMVEGKQTIKNDDTNRNTNTTLKIPK